MDDNLKLGFLLPKDKQELSKLQSKYKHYLENYLQNPDFIYKLMLYGSWLYRSEISEQEAKVKLIEVMDGFGVDIVCFPVLWDFLTKWPNIGLGFDFSLLGDKDLGRKKDDELIQLHHRIYADYLDRLTATEIFKKYENEGYDLTIDNVNKIIRRTKKYYGGARRKPKGH